MQRQYKHFSFFNLSRGLQKSPSVKDASGLLEDTMTLVKSPSESLQHEDIVLA